MILGPDRGRWWTLSGVAEKVLKQNPYCGHLFAFRGRRGDLIKVIWFDGQGEHAREKIAAWIDDYNAERPHSSLGYATPAAFAAELEKQWAASLRIAEG